MNRFSVDVRESTYVTAVTAPLDKVTTILELAMHRVLNAKHRIIRRTEVERAPLATFDIDDLGDDDNKKSKTRSNANNRLLTQEKTSCKEYLEIRLCDAGIQKPETIGGNHSKKALSQAGGEGKEEKPADPPVQSEENCHSAGDDRRLQTAATTEDTSSEDKECRPVDEDKSLSKTPIKECKEDLVSADCQKPSAVPPLASANLTRQGTLGRVNIPIKKQNSVSSSSSSEACNDSHFTFTTSRPSIAHLDSAEGGYDLPDSLSHKGSVSNLVPVNIDPKQILSPSKRKAYEKRLERLKVTTSPIARPRSNAPINVVTLDEYANISSPEHSPVPHSILQDKLKITLPSDEFTRSSRAGSSKRKDSEDTCFEFSEEILFRCTKSALVVDEDGQLPVSPRRVLIPPTITPTNSPKLSSSPRLSTDSTGDNTQTHGAPKLIYMKEDDDPAHKFFGLTFDEPENENWADFPDSSHASVEKADTECSEKEEFSGKTSGQSESCTPESSVTTETEKSLNDAYVDVVTDDSKGFVADNFVNSFPCERENNFSGGYSDNHTSDSDVRADSTPEGLKTLEDSVTSEDCIRSVTLEDKPNPVEFLVEDKCQSPIENTSLCDKTEAVIVDIPFIDDSEKSTSTGITAEGTDTGLPPASVDDFLIHLSNISNSKKPESFEGEGYNSESTGDCSVQQGGISTNPFSLLDGPTHFEEASIISPIPISSTDILQPATTHTQADNFSSVSLNPFLQDLSTTPETFDPSTCIESKVESASGNVESQVQESHPSFIDLNIPTAKSTSSSADLIDFSSSLDLDLPPPQ